MILKGSQRGGAGQLAQHLLRTDENDHVVVEQLRGFMSSDLEGALDEAHAISKGTKCTQFLFSLSLNPPKDQEVSLDSIMEAVERAEEKLGLQGQPRAVVIHEKNGRRHAHAVWSRIMADNMKAVPMPFFKNHLAGLSKELYLEHGWVLPDGHKENGWKNPLNFTLAEWQQAKRLDLDPREIKQLFRDAWDHSDGLKSFRAALEDRGYYLAQGDRRGVVAVDIHGEVFSVARMVGIKTKDLEARLGSPDRLSKVEAVRDDTRSRLNVGLRDRMQASRREQRRELAPLRWQHRQTVRAQRAERAQLAEAQTQHRTTRNKERASRLHTGVRGALEFLTGRTFYIRSQNAGEAQEDYLQYRRERERLFEAQMQERRDTLRRIADLRATQRAERMRTAGQIAFLMDLERSESQPHKPTPRPKDHGLDFH